MPGFSYPPPMGSDFVGGERKENDNDRDGPIVGSSYNGSKVIDVQVEVTDRGARIRKRSIIKLENGAILKEDHWKDKVFQEVDTSRRRAPIRSKVSDHQLPEMATGGAAGHSRGLGPKTKSGRHLPKPVPTQRRAVNGSTAALPPKRSESPARESVRRGSRGGDFIRAPPGVSKSSDLEELQVSSHNPRGRRSAVQQKGGYDMEDRATSPEPSPNPLSFRNMSNFLISPKRQPPGNSKSGNDLDALRDSLHSPALTLLPPRGDSKPPRGISAMGTGGDKHSDAAPETPQRQPRSLKKLGVLISPRLKPTKTKSGELDLMQASLQTADKQFKSEPFKLEQSSSVPTAESNREKLRSFKNMIAMPSPKRSTRTPSPAAVKRDKESKPRRSSIQHDEQQQVPEKSRRGSLQHQQLPRSPGARHGSTSNQATREPSLSPDEVKKPASSSYISSFLDSLYDNYVDPKGAGDEDSDDDGYGKSHSLLESSLNMFVEWAE